MATIGQLQNQHTKSYILGMFCLHLLSMVVDLFSFTFDMRIMVGSSTQV